jgi:hypothetical protein
MRRGGFRQRINPLVNSGRTSPVAQRIGQHTFIAMARNTRREEEGAGPYDEDGLLTETGWYLLLESGDPLLLEA